MRYQWDPNKAAINLRKHGVDFADAVSVFSDDFALSFEDTRFDEERYVVIGADLLDRILVIVYTWRNKEVRLISARKATRRERQQYMEES